MTLEGPTTRTLARGASASTATADGITEHTFLGVDFSGDSRMWAQSRAKTNVWVATVFEVGRALILHDIRSVQHLPGPGQPFDRLARLLRTPTYSAAGIDAPFSVPESRWPGASHQALLADVARWERGGRPFAPATTLIRHLVPDAGPLGVKEYRATERGLGLNVRSTTWAGPRGGTAMTVACLTLLGCVRRPIWPLVETSLPGIVVEAFPAAQLKTWGLPFYGYNGGSPSAQDERRRILSGLRKRVEISGHDNLLLQSADALDAVVCAFAGVAVRNHALARHPQGAHSTEGWIAVHQ